MRQRNAAVSIVGLIIFIGLIVLCIAFGNHAIDETPEVTTVADKLASIRDENYIIADGEAETFVADAA